MARRRTKNLKRDMIPDPVYNSTLVTKFINCMMKDGKKATTEKVFYDALQLLSERTGENGFDVFTKALEKIKPQVEVKSRRVGGVSYQVPVEVYPSRQNSLAIRWIINSSRSKTGQAMHKKLAQELQDAFNDTGGAFKKKEDVKRMADANRAFAHYAY